MKDFGDMDSFSGPGLVLPGQGHWKASTIKTHKWPGHGLAEDACYYQFVEGEYMKADEYDRLMKDPTDFCLRVILPRAAALFEPLKKLPPPASFRWAGWVIVPLFADPDIRRHSRR